MDKQVRNSRQRPQTTKGEHQREKHSGLCSPYGDIMCRASNENLRKLRNLLEPQ